MEWIENGCTGDLTYASFELKKYHKHLMRLHIQKGILVRQFFDDTGKISHSQVCVPKHSRKEVIYRIHNSSTGGHLGIVRTAEEFRKRFYFPGFSEYLIVLHQELPSLLDSQKSHQKTIASTTSTNFIRTTFSG